MSLLLLFPDLGSPIDNPNDTYLVVSSTGPDVLDLYVEGSLTQTWKNGEVFLPSSTIYTPTAANVNAGASLTISRTFVRVAGTGGPIDITANPQLEAGQDGQVVILEGTSDTNTVTIDDGDGVHLHSGSMILADHCVLALIYSSSEVRWVEQYRNTDGLTPVSTKTADYTAVTSDEAILCDATSGVITITLPAASTMSNRTLTINKIDSSSNTVTIDGNASETINGVTTLVMTYQYTSRTIVSDGSNWHVI